MTRLGWARHNPGDDAEMAAYSRAVKPPWCKMLDAFPRGLADAQHAHGGKVVGRVYFPRQELADGPAAIAKVVEQAQLHPWVDAWELFNECHSTATELPAYAELSINFADAMRAIGRGAVIGSFSQGTPGIGSFAADYAPALRYAGNRRGSVFLALHEYAEYDMAADSPWHTNRHKLFIAAMERAGIPVPDILITESGLDDIHGKKQKTGWRQKVSGAEYARQQEVYCRGVHPAVKGVVGYGDGVTEASEWAPFNLFADSAAVDEMIRRQRGIPIQGAAPVADLSREAAAKAAWAMEDSNLFGKVAVLEAEGTPATIAAARRIRETYQQIVKERDRPNR